MALEYRNGVPYYYRKVRKGNKVISEYVGSGDLALMAAELHVDEQYSIKAKKDLKRNEQALHRQFDEELTNLEKKINQLFTQTAIENGYHKTKRQWRKKRQKI